MSQFGFIYKTTNMVNGRAYVGMCSSSQRFKHYLGSGKLLTSAINKYGKDNFKREILEWCNSDKELRIAEVRWMEHYDAVKSESFYNLHEGGRGGHTGSGYSTSDMVKKTWDSYTAEEKKSRVGHLGKWNKFGVKNPTAKKALVNNKEYACLKDALKDYPHVPYSSLKRIAQKGTYNKTHNLKAEYL